MQKTIRVHANPWLCLDEDGSPSCAVAIADAPTRHIGAQLVIRQRGGEFHQGFSVNGVALTGDKLGFEFSDGPVELKIAMVGDQLRYYRNAVAEGALVCADKDTADLLGAKFEDPAKKIAESKAQAAVKFEGMFGKAPEWAEPKKKADKAGQGG